MKNGGQHRRHQRTRPRGPRTAGGRPVPLPRPRKLAAGGRIRDPDPAGAGRDREGAPPVPDEARRRLAGGRHDRAGRRRTVRAGGTRDGRPRGMRDAHLPERLHDAGPGHHHAGTRHRGPAAFGDRQPAGGRPADRPLLCGPAECRRQGGTIRRDRRGAVGAQPQPPDPGRTQSGRCAAGRRHAGRP